MSSAKLLDPAVQREAESVFAASTDEVVLAALTVLKVKQQGESPGAHLLKALGGKVRATGPMPSRAAPLTLPPSPHAEPASLASAAADIPG